MSAYQLNLMKLVLECVSYDPYNMKKGDDCRIHIAHRAHSCGSEDIPRDAPSYHTIRPPTDTGLFTYTIIPNGSTTHQTGIVKGGRC